MSEYATLKRRPILFPDSVSSFHDSIFSLKEELKALVADDLQNKDAYVQTAVEIAIDLRSALADWTLTKLVDDDTRVAAQRQRRALHPHVRLAVDDDTVALHKRRRRRGEPSEAVDFHSDVLLVVAQRDVGASLTTRVDLRDLPGHPYGGPTFDRRVELLAEQAHRPRVVGGGFRRQTGQRLRRPLRRRWVVIRVPSHKSRFHHLADKWNICSSVANAPCVKIVRCVGLCQNDTPR